MSGQRERLVGRLKYLERRVEQIHLEISQLDFEIRTIETSLYYAGAFNAETRRMNRQLLKKQGIRAQKWDRVAAFSAESKRFASNSQSPKPLQLLLRLQSWLRQHRVGRRLRESLLIAHSPKCGITDLVSDRAPSDLVWALLESDRLDPDVTFEAGFVGQYGGERHVGFFARSLPVFDVAGAGT